MRLLERITNVLGWPAIGVGFAHWLFGWALIPQFAFAGMGLVIGLLMPSLFRRKAQNIGATCNDMEQADGEEATVRSRS